MPESERFRVGRGPIGLALDEERATLAVLSAFDRSVALVGLGDGETSFIALSHREGAGLSPASAEGRALFHDAENRALSGDGRACASCHPEGRDDGLTWPTPKGPRQTIALAGRLKGPFGWNGQSTTLADHVRANTKNTGGTGLGENDIAKIVAWMTVMETPPRIEKERTAEEARGRTLYESEALGCANCHQEGNRRLFDVGSATTADKTKKFVAPSLKFVVGSAPYFHDGRYPTLGALLHDRESKMSTLKDVSDEDLAAIEAYVRTL